MAGQVRGSTATTVYDLRYYFLAADYSDASTDQGTDAETPPDSAGADQGDEDSTSAATGGDDGSADAAGEGEVKDPEKKRLSDEAAKHRIRAKTAENSLAASAAMINDLRIENAFIRAALPVIADTDAAWKLADHSLVKVDDDGNVTGMAEMVTATLRAYPYLERSVDTMPTLMAGAGGSPSNGRRGKNDGLNSAALESKYPALRRR